MFIQYWTFERINFLTLLFALIVFRLTINSFFSIFDLILRFLFLHSQEADFNSQNRRDILFHSHWAVLKQRLVGWILFFEEQVEQCVQILEIVKFWFFLKSGQRYFHPNPPSVQKRKRMVTKSKNTGNKKSKTKVASLNGANLVKL